MRMKLHGTVVGRSGSRVQVRPGRPPECDRCGSCPETGVELFECPGPGLEIGDRVELEMADGELVGIVLLLYLLPASLLVVSFLILSFFFSEGRALALAFLSLLISVPAARRRARARPPVPTVRKAAGDSQARPPQEA